ncbi:MAG: hypothetical protein QXR45_09410 [Candidatus Bathyarchaeia archaeon]
MVVVIAWGIVLASIILQNLYRGLTLDSVGLASIFLISFFAGIIIGDLRLIAFGWFFSLIFSMTLVFFVLCSPVFLGLVWDGGIIHEFYAGVIVMIFRAVFPTVVMICLFACFLGGLAGNLFSI